MSNDEITPETQNKMALLEREHERMEKMIGLAETLSDFINSADTDEISDFAEAIATDHPTLVQKKFGMFLSFCKVLDTKKKDGHYDARNQFSCETAGKILELTNGGTRCPFI